MSSSILDEYHELAFKPRVVALFNRYDVSRSELSAMLTLLVENASLVQLDGEAPPCRDEDDRMYLHCALVSQADWLITRDKDLLEVGTIGTAAILVPEEFIQQLDQGGVELEA